MNPFMPQPSPRGEPVVRGRSPASTRPEDPALPQWRRPRATRSRSASCCGCGTRCSAGWSTRGRARRWEDRRDGEQLDRSGREDARGYRGRHGGDHPDDRTGREVHVVVRGLVGPRIILRPPGDPEEEAFRLHRPREEHAQVAGDHLLEGHPARIVRQRHPSRPVGRHLDPHETAVPATRPGDQYRQVEPRLLMNGNGCAASAASGTRTGSTESAKYRARKSRWDGSRSPISTIGVPRSRRAGRNCSSTSLATSPCWDRSSARQAPSTSAGV